MKKIVALGTVVLMLSTVFSGVSYARDEGWYAAGGLLGGLILGSAITASSRPYYYPAPAYYSRPGYYYQGAYAYPVYPTCSTTYTTYYPSTTYVDSYCY